MRDLKLYQRIKQFCQDGIDFAAKLVGSGEEIPNRIAEKYIVVDDHTVSEEKTVMIDWFKLIINKESEIQRLDSYIKAAAALNDHKVLGPQVKNLVGTGGSMRRIDANELLRILLLDLLMENAEPVFEEKKFNQIYERMENWYYAEKLRFRYFSPISNFSMEQDRLELAPNFAIVKITKEDKERLLASSSAFNPTYHLLAFKEYAFEYIADQLKYIGDDRPQEIEVRLQPQEAARSLFKDARSALRLFKAGLIGFNYMWMLDTIWNFQGTSSTFNNTDPVDYHGTPLKLSKEEVDEFLELWKRYRKISERGLKKILNAVARLNFGTSRGNPEDKIVDYYVGFESLFLNDNNPELKYRLALFVAHWLGTDALDRKKIYKMISKGYDQRSKIVHGGNPKQTINIDGSDLSISQQAELVEAYLRSAVKKFIVECDTNDENEIQLVEKLRDKILE